jgi:hypothetical protein
MELRMTFRLLHIGALVVACVVGLSACSRKTAEEKGAEMAKEKIDLVKGIGGVLEEHGSVAAESVAHGTGEVMSGLESGFEKSFGRRIVSSPALSDAGITVSKVQNATMQGDKPVHGIDVYVVADKDVAGKLKLIARDKRKNELARTSLPVKFAAGDGRYETIELDSRVALNEVMEISFDFVADAPVTASVSAAAAK